MAEEAPEWYRTALASKPRHGTTSVAGAEIAYSAWGEPGGEGLVLLHGGAANARWWDHVAPLLAEQRQVVAVDLSGHGDSARRPAYGLDVWADEVHHVIAAAGIRRPAVVVGHSMGGFVTLQTANRYGAELNGVIILDSPVHDLTPEERAAFDKRAFGPLRRYSSREAAIARFRPVPEQDFVLPYVGRHVAENSVAESAGAWAWKFDPMIFRRAAMSPDYLTRLPCRVALFRAEHGRLSKQLSESMYDRLGRAAPMIEIPAAGHHMMLDQPLALVTGLRTLLSDWEHSTTIVGP